jgi:hypothetical protein
MLIGMPDRKKPWDFKKGCSGTGHPGMISLVATSLYRNFFAAGFRRYVT